MRGSEHDNYWSEPEIYIPTMKPAGNARDMQDTTQYYAGSPISAPGCLCIIYFYLYVSAPIFQMSWNCCIFIMLD